MDTVAPPRPGEELGPILLEVTRERLVRYAGASGDFNPIHWNERAAREVDLPGVIAHGMFTMGAALRLVTDRFGDPGAVLEYAVRFSRPVVVPDPGAAMLEVRGTVTEVAGDRATVLLRVADDGVNVLGKARVVVRVPA